jgi:hypothetical protein
MLLIRGWRFPDSMLMNNHLLIDPVQAIYPERSTKHYALRKKVRDVVFDELKSIRDVPRKRTIIFTSCNAKIEADREVFEDYLEVAHARVVRFLWLNLVCDRDTHLERLGTGERLEAERQYASRKLTLPEDLLNLLAKHELLRPEHCKEELEAASLPVQFAELDTTELDAEKTVDAIMKLCTWVEFDVEPRKKSLAVLAA